MNNRTKFSLSFICFIVLSCHSSISQNVNYYQIQINELAKDFKLPKKIFDQIESNIAAVSSSVRPVYVFLPLKVKLFSAQNSVLKNDSIEISLPNGGGEIDLKNYILNQGTFSLSFSKEQFQNLPKIEFLYFLSETVSATIDQEIFGLGCGKMANLSKQFESLQKNDFLKLNTTDQRHMFVAAGYYIFVFRENNQVYLTHLHLTDSRYNKSLCSTIL